MCEKVHSSLVCGGIDIVHSKALFRTWYWMFKHFLKQYTGRHQIFQKLTTQYNSHFAKTMSTRFRSTKAVIKINRKYTQIGIFGSNQL